MKVGPMSTWKLETPVAFIVFNRPEPTRRVFEQIRAARPPKLLIVADGPRADRAGEAERCAQTRAIAQQVDWPCEVETEFSAVNLGCRRRVASGIDWVFSRVPEAIILEDDCLPHASFFRYCAELLGRYREDSRVGMIAGTRLHPKDAPGEASYFFSRYASIWGWATWRRAWARYDHGAAQWPELYRSGAFHGLTLPCERLYWQSAFEGVHGGAIDTWDYQWNLTCWCESMLSVVPRGNLISNIGFGPDATHTKTVERYANLPAAAMQFPLVHPHLVLSDRAADAAYAAILFGESWRGKLKRRLGLRRLRRFIAGLPLAKPARASPSAVQTGAASSE
jgi:hypothetical protein